MAPLTVETYSPMAIESTSLSSPSSKLPGSKGQSCASEKHMLSREPSPEPDAASTFDWSDFPIICRSLDDHSEMRGKINVALIPTMMTISKPRKKQKTNKRVSFSKLEIQEHAVVVGDHPCCGEGLPLSLGWEHSPPETVDLETWEKARAGHRRSGMTMKLSYYERKNMLKRISGFTESDLVELDREWRRSTPSGLHHVTSTRTLIHWT